MILEIFWTVSLIKSPRLLRWSWILNEFNFSWKIVKYCILYEVCMIKTAPHSTLSPQMWCIKKIIIIKDWFARTQIYWQEFVNLSNAKFDLICFPRICFPRLIYCDQEPLLLLNVTEDYFLGVHLRLYQLDTRFVSLQNHLAFPSKVTWMCP